MEREIENLDGERYFVSELDDIVISTSNLEPRRIVLQKYIGGTSYEEILNVIYYPYASSIHIDIREAIMSALDTEIPLFGPVPSVVNPNSSVYLRLSVFSMAGLGEHYVDFTAILGSPEIWYKTTDIDELRVPGNYRIPVTLYNGSWDTTPQQDSYTVKLVTHKRVSAIGVSQLDTESGALAVGCYVASELPVNPGTPFQMAFVPAWFRFPSIGRREIIYTPALTVVPGQFEQYLFLNKYGAWDNVPMSGDLKYIPEYDIENALHNGGHVKGHAVMDEIYEQNSGYLSRKTVKALSELLLSDRIYHLEDGEWKRIVIDSPDISLSKKDSVHNLMFRWIHAENEE